MRKGFDQMACNSVSQIRKGEFFAFPVVFGFDRRADGRAGLRVDDKAMVICSQVCNNLDDFYMDFGSREECGTKSKKYTTTSGNNWTAHVYKERLNLGLVSMSVTFMFDGEVFGKAYFKHFSYSFLCFTRYFGMCDNQVTVNRFVSGMRLGVEIVGKCDNFSQVLLTETTF